MSNVNARASELVAELGAVPPTNQAVGTITTGWLSLANFQNVLAAVRSGTLGASASVTAKLQQATDTSGTAAKDLTGKAITAITANNKTALINLNAQELDVANGFDCVQLQITVATATSYVQGEVLGLNCRYNPTSDWNGVQVTQVVL